MADSIPLQLDAAAASWPPDLPSPEGEANAFWRMRGRLAFTVLAQTLSRARFRVSLVATLSALLWLGLFYLFADGFLFLKNAITDPGFHQTMVEFVFAFFFAAMTMMLVFSAWIILYGSLFRSSDVTLLLTIPARAERIFLFKLQEAILLSSWAFILLGSPMLLAYGIVSEAPWYYFAMLVPFLIAFTYIPAGIGGICCLLVVRFVPRARVIALVLLALAVFLLGVAVIWSITGGASSELMTYARDSFLTVSLSWILLPAFGALAYIISQSIPSYTDAFFESVSGFSTTGASILTNIEILPYSVLFWRSLTHWIGGFGIVLLFLLILPSLRVTGYQLFSLESSLKEKIHPKTKGIALRILLIYTGLTLLETIFLVLGDMNLFDSLCHSFGTIATGGFSTKNISLEFYSPYSQYVVMLFMFLAGTSQVIYYHLVKRNFMKVKHNEEFWFYLAIVLVTGAIAASILLSETPRSPEEAIREGYFQVVSIITCTGFANDDFILWPQAGMMLLFLLMFSGGSMGSTSGGIKIGRHLLVIKNFRIVVTRLVHPNIYPALKLNGKLIDEKTNTSIISFILLYFFIFLVGTTFIVLNGSDPVTSATSVATCMAGIGPGLGTVGPMSNFSGLPGISKITLSLVMIIGRLEIIPVFILFGKSFWKL